MKILIILIVLLFLNSCISQNIENKRTETKTNKITEIKSEKLENNKIIKNKKEILSEAESYLLENNYKTNKLENKKAELSFFNKEVKFTFCSSLDRYKGDILKFEKTDKNIEIISKIFFDRSPGYSKGVIEFCRNKDSTKYIGVIDDYGTLQFFQYDAKLQKVKKAKYIGFFNKRDIDNYKNIVSRDYGNDALVKFHGDYIKNKEYLQGFGKKNKNIIPYSNYGVSITGSKEGTPGILSDRFQFFSDKTRKYCEGGLTSKGYLPVCFINIFYEYDYIKNEISEKRICSYYINDMGIAQKLEKCFDINKVKKGYKLVGKTKGVDFYQNKSGDLSIIDVDLTSAGISFGGVKINKKSDFDKFDKFYASEFEYDYEKFNSYFLVNGQFFTNLKKNNTALSFPLKSNGKILTDYIDNNIPKRTFIIDENNNAKILEGYKKEYLENNKNREVITAFNPEVPARKNAKIGRTYIGLKSPKNAIFFIAKNKTQEQMNKIISDYGIKTENIIMMDGGPSSQFAYFENNGPGSEWKQFYGLWKVPQFFVVYNK